ncbi:MAG: DUF1343 domain-containing protein [Nitrospirae bacterium]|nr:DUF1343 domain-containing protein [Nitrospirota bacterium]
MFRRMSIIWLIGLVLGIIPSSRAATSAENLSSRVRIKLGVEVLLEKRLDLLKGKRVGLITNPTGVDRNLKTTVDLLWENPQVKLVALFGPEHGIRGDIPAGQYTKSYLDKKTGLPVFSLYGKTRKPTPEMLKGIDVLVFDIQDIGTRYYTYIYTMALSMEAAKEKGIEFIVLDRPNPIGGTNVEGPVLEKKFKSFIGMYPIPIVPGMTAGELAELFNNEFGIGAKLTIVKMEGWKREMFFEETGLAWINPSPHIPTPLTARLYPATGFIGELKVVSNGIGTTRPFEYIGAPWIEADKLAKELNRSRLPGVYFRPVHYQPFYGLYARKECNGVQIHILDEQKFKPVATGIHIISAIKKLYPGKIKFSGALGSFDKTLGTAKVRLSLQAGKSPEAIIASWQNDLKKFLTLRRQISSL